MPLSESRACSRSARNWPWRSRVSRSNSLTARTPRALRPSSIVTRIRAHWPWAQLSFSARSVRLAVSSLHRPPNWSRRWCRCRRTVAARWHSRSSSSTNGAVGPSRMMRAVRSPTAWASSCGATPWTGKAPRTAAPSVVTTPPHAGASSAARASSPARAATRGASTGSAAASTARADAPTPTGTAAASTTTGTAGASTATDAAGASTTTGAAGSASQLATSCVRRCCNRRASLRLPSSTRCRLSFLRAEVQPRLPRSRPRTMRSISSAIAAPSLAAGSPASRA